MSKFTTNSIKDLTPEQLKMLPDEQAVLDYQQKGWHISPIIIPEELIDAAVEGAHAFYAGEKDWQVDNLQRIANDAIDSKKVLRNNEMTSLQKKEIADLINYKMMAATAATLAQTSGIRLFADALIYKQPQKGADPGVVGWHADRAYWPTCTSRNMLTAWIPFQDCTVDMGPVFYISESHKWYNDPRWQSFYNFNNQRLDELDNFLKTEKPDHERVAMTLKKGQVSFHHGYTIHASRPNTSDQDRLALAVHLQDYDNKYQPAYKDDGSRIEIGYDLVCGKDKNGNPDYSDPAVFPTLFRF